jgi:hypothetical protein
MIAYSCFSRTFFVAPSTWTIDLAYLLKRFNVIFKYFTSTPGICPVYYHHRYYTTVLPNVRCTVVIEFCNYHKSLTVYLTLDRLLIL